MTDTQPTRPTFTPEQEREIAWQQPFDSADYLDPRPRPAVHLTPLVMPDGTVVDLNSPIAFHKPQS